MEEAMKRPRRLLPWWTLSLGTTRPRESEGAIAAAIDKATVLTFAADVASVDLVVGTLPQMRLRRGEVKSKLKQSQE